MKVYQVVKREDSGNEINRGFYAYERDAMKDVKSRNDRIIRLLSREIATLNGAIRGNGQARMHAIQSILTNLPYKMNKIHVDDNYR